MYKVHIEVECVEGTDLPKCCHVQLLHVFTRHHRGKAVKTVVCERELVLPHPWTGRKLRAAREALEVDAAGRNARLPNLFDGVQ